MRRESRLPHFATHLAGNFDRKLHRLVLGKIIVSPVIATFNFVQRCQCPRVSLLPLDPLDLIQPIRRNNRDLRATTEFDDDRLV